MSRAKTQRPGGKPRAQTAGTVSDKKAYVPPPATTAEPTVDNKKAYVPPPAKAYVPPPAKAYVPPPAKAYVPPPAKAYVPPPAKAYVPPPAAAAKPVVIARATSVNEDQFVEITELADLLPLQIAVHETAAHLTTVAQAITQAGHVMAVGTSGREGVDKITYAVGDGQIDAVLVGIPGGEAIIDAALALEPRRPVIIAACSGGGIDAVARAHSSGADLVTVRPHDAEKLAPVLLAASRLVEQRRAATNARGSEAVLRSRLDQIADGDPGGLQPLGTFQRALELELKRAKRYKYQLSVALFVVEIPPPPPPPGVRGILRARAGNALIHSIRDIDMATELDQDRFLVLLPYTDLGGAAEVARRILAAVASGDPVIAMGRSFTPRVIGAVAGGSPGQQVSFSKLMRDATRTLDQARKDGADLAVAV